jgi:hypothetical protein
MTPEGLEHTTPSTPGASRLHGPQSNIAHALPSDMPRGRGTEDIDNADIHEDLKAPGMRPQRRACVP